MTYFSFSNFLHSEPYLLSAVLKLTRHWSVIASDRSVPVLRCLYGQRLRSDYFVAKPNRQFFANVTGVLRLNNAGVLEWMQGVPALIPPVMWIKKKIHTRYF